KSAGPTGRSLRRRGSLAERLGPVYQLSPKQGQPTHANPPPCTLPSSIGVAWHRVRTTKVAGRIVATLAVRRGVTPLTPKFISSLADAGLLANARSAEMARRAAT